ncbi:MAG: GerW family sporulation protein [Eubacteriales bacterium]|nr:GerW family sporulation protein [Eubacteriales bacterium]
MADIKADYKLTDDGMGLTIEALFQGMQGLVQSKTVVGEPIRVDGATIVPLIEVTAGLASGALDRKKAKTNGAGAMSAKLSPVALLIIQNGMTKLVSVKNQDVFTKLLDMIPDAVDRFTGAHISNAAQEAAEEMAAAPEAVYEVTPAPEEN